MPFDTVHGCFEEQARLAPESPALIFRDSQMTYRELNAASNQLARKLLSKGVKPGCRLAVCLERSPMLIVAQLAALKAGAAYVPLDPAWPSDRLESILEQASVAAVIGLPWGISPDAPGESEENLAAAETSAACIMFTSGSTGFPKGAVVPHKGIVRLVKGADYVDFGAGETFLQLAPPSFDAATFEIFGALLNGGRLVLMPSGSPALPQIADALIHYKVTTLWLSAGLFQLVVDHSLEALRFVRQLIAGGDVLSPMHVRKAITRWPECRLINGYGPTETTTFACCHRILPRDLDRQSIPIGRPIHRTSVWILDEQMNACPAGVPGEIYIGGDGVAQGYLNQPELTAERFLPDPFSSGGTLYRTGDRGRLLEGGAIEFLGRFDDQVKLNGYRVEPGEIERLLMTYPGVRQAAVAVREEGGSKRLAAFIAPGLSGGTLDVRRFLLAKLPPYMVPHEISFVASLPITPNGKVDRKELLASQKKALDPSVQPRTRLEQIVREAWSKALGGSHFTIDSNFFDAGGDSLRLMAVHARITREVAPDLPITALFAYPTVRSLAAYLDKGSEAGSLSSATDNALRQKRALEAKQALTKAVTL